MIQHTLIKENFQKFSKMLKKRKKLAHRCVVKLATSAFQGFMQTLVYLITSNLRTRTQAFCFDL